MWIYIDFVSLIIYLKLLQKISLKIIHKILWYHLFCSYFRASLILEKIISIGKFKPYDQGWLEHKHMVLDTQALQHLDIFETSIGKTRSSAGSLNEYLDKCCTLYGKRMLKKWIAAPWLDEKKIGLRLDAVENLIGLGN